MKHYAPSQKLLRVDCGAQGFYVVRRGSDGRGYFLEGYAEGARFLKDAAAFLFPIDQTDVEREFASAGREWRREP